MSTAFTTVYFPPRPIARRRFFFKSPLRSYFGPSAKVLCEIFDGSLREERDPKAAAIREFGWAIRRNRETRTSGNFRPSLRTCIGCGIRLERVVTSRNGLKTFTTGLWKHVSLPLPWCQYHSVPFHSVEEGSGSRFASDVSRDSLAPWRNCGREHSRVLFTTVNDVKKKESDS